MAGKGHPREERRDQEVGIAVGGQSRREETRGQISAEKDPGHEKEDRGQEKGGEAKADPTPEGKVKSLRRNTEMRAGHPKFGLVWVPNYDLYLRNLRSASPYYHLFCCEFHV